MYTNIIPTQSIRSDPGPIFGLPCLFKTTNSWVMTHWYSWDLPAQKQVADSLYSVYSLPILQLLSLSSDDKLWPCCYRWPQLMIADKAIKCIVQVEHCSGRAVNAWVRWALFSWISREIFLLSDSESFWWRNHCCEIAKSPSKYKAYCSVRHATQTWEDKKEEKITMDKIYNEQKMITSSKD